MRRTVLALLLALTATGPSVAQSQKQAPPPAPPETSAPATAPYDAQLSRLAEIIGALTYLRPLCGIEGEDWRRKMQAILDTETQNEPARRAHMTAAFNRGYRSFAAMHTSCSPAALVAEGRYRAEAATLVAEITSRFGN